MRPDIKFKVGIIIRQGKAYIETQAITDEGATINIEPVYIINPSSDDIEKTLVKMIKAGNPRIPHPKDLSNIKPVMLIAAKVKSWKKLAQNAAAYSIVWRLNDIVLEMSIPNSKFEWDKARTRYFTPDTDIKIVVQAILDDVNSRPEIRS